LCAAGIGSSHILCMSVCRHTDHTTVCVVLMPGCVCLCCADVSPSHHRPELAFMRVPGVIATEVGYSQGKVEDPSYEDVCSGQTGHVEVVQVTYNSQEVGRCLSGVENTVASCITGVAAGTTQLQQAQEHSQCVCGLCCGWLVRHDRGRQQKLARPQPCPGRSCLVTPTTAPLHACHLPFPAD
jgi:hypothetical protein